MWERSIAILIVTFRTPQSNAMYMCEHHAIPPLVGLRYDIPMAEGEAKAQPLKPAKEVAAKMRPVTREAFTNLVRRAATSPARQSHPKAKRTSAH